MGTILLIVVGVFALVFARATMSRIDDITDRDIRWVQKVGTADGAVFELIRSYLYRLRIHRWMGATAGVVFAVLLSQGAGVRTTAGIGADAPWADVVFCGLFGMLLCSLLAESNRVLPLLVRRSREDAVASVPIQASWLQPLSWMLTASVVLLALVESDGRANGMAIIAVIFAVVYGVFLAVLRGGRRPLRALDIRHADDSLREYAENRIALEAVATAVLFGGWAFSTTVLAGKGFAGLLLMASLGTSFALLVQSRPYPARS